MANMALHATPAASLARRSTHGRAPTFGGGGRMIEVDREPDDVAVLISGKEVGVEDAGDSYVLAGCDLADLENEAAQPFPQGLTLQVRSEDGFGTYLFKDKTRRGPRHVIWLGLLG